MLILIGLVLQLNQPLDVVRDRAVFATPAFAGYEPHFSGDGKTFLTAGYDGTLEFWSAQPRGKTAFLDALRIKDSPGNSYSLSYNGQKLAISSPKGRIEVWQRSPLKMVDGFTVPTPAYGSVQLHPNKPWLIYDQGGSTYRRDITNGQTIKLDLTGPLKLIPNTTTAVSLGGLIDLSNGKLIRSFRSKLDNDMPMSISPDHKLVVIAGEDPTWTAPAYAASESAYIRQQSLRIWRLSDGKLLRTLPGFSTSGGTDTTVLWTSNRTLKAPSLGWERNVLSGKLLKRFDPMESDAYTRPPNVVPAIRTEQGKQSLVKLTLPAMGEQVLQATPETSGSLLIEHERKATYRAGGNTSGRILTLGRLVPNGALSPIDVDLSRVSGELGSDGKGPYFDRTLMFSSQDTETLYKMRGRPGSSKESAWDVDRVVMRPGKPSEELHYRFEGTNPVTKFPPEGGYGPFSSREGVLAGDRFIFASPFSANSVNCVSLSSGKILWTQTEPKMRVDLTTLSASRDWFAFSQEDYSNPQRSRQMLCIGKAGAGEILFRIQTSGVYQTRFSPDGNRLAVFGDSLGIVDLTQPEPTFLPLFTQTNPFGGDMSDAHILWIDNGRRLLIANSLRPIQLVDAGSRQLLASLGLFDGNTWLALGADGQVDGSPSRMNLARVWTGDHWALPVRKPGFFFELMNG
ncbi:MAG TPA: hypothetical protein VG944_20595 [Fimbriimonas sp.]|nr:hypothetical protein [Fimbriimonas sp.]